MSTVQLAVGPPPIQGENDADTDNKEQVAAAAERDGKMRIVRVPWRATQIVEERRRDTAA